MILPPIGDYRATKYAQLLICKHSWPLIQASIALSTTGCKVCGPRPRGGSLGSSVCRRSGAHSSKHPTVGVARALAKKILELEGTQHEGSSAGRACSGLMREIAGQAAPTAQRLGGLQTLTPDGSAFRSPHSPAIRSMLLGTLSPLRLAFTKCP